MDNLSLHQARLTESGFWFLSQNCSTDPAGGISERLSSMREVFVRRFISVTHDSQRSMAEQRYQLSVRLYLRVLEALLVAVSLQSMHKFPHYIKK